MKGQLKSKALILMLIIAVVMTYMPLNFAADVKVWAASEAWDGSVSETLTQDAEGWYLISSGADLAKFAEMVNYDGETTINGRLTSCINLGENQWTPIGLGIEYSGTFDGDGHVIEGLYMDSGEEYAGLFGMINGGDVSNLTVKGTIMGGSTFAGGIAGYSSGASTFSNCGSYVEISDAANAGGIVGYVEGAESVALENCFNHGSIAAYEYAGGLIGFSTADVTKITASYNDAAISSDLGMDGCGGLFGYVAGTLELGNCYQSGEIDGYAFGVVDMTPEFTGPLGVFGHSGDTDPANSAYDYEFIFPDDREGFLTEAEAYFNNEGKLLWEAETHTDESLATDEQKAEALAKLTYNAEDYYDEQLGEIESIIADAEAELSELSITPSSLDSYIETIQGKINKVKNKEYVDAVNAGKKAIDDKVAGLSQEDYDAEDWTTIMKKADSAKQQIDSAAKDKIGSIVDETISFIGSVMTSQQKAEIPKNRAAAKKQVADYIAAVRTEFEQQVSALGDNAEAKAALQKQQEEIDSLSFAPYLDGGEKAAELDKLVLAADMNKWVEDAKADIDRNKTKGMVTVISDSESLFSFAEKVNGSTADNDTSSLFAIVTKDIDASNKSWTPIGKNTSHPYSGMFFGNGHKITLNCSMTGSDSSGLFGVVSGAHIEGITVAGNIGGKIGSGSAKAGTAGIAGYVYGSQYGTDTTIEDCTNEATINGANNTAGIVGFVYGSGSAYKAALTLNNCSNNGEIKGSYYAAGIVSRIGNNYVKKVTVRDTDNNGNITATNNSCGGIAGYAQFAAEISGCTNTGDVTLNTTSTNASKGVGGILGFADANGISVTNCGNAGAVKGPQYIGGIVGAGNTAAINTCYNTGDVTITAANGNEQYAGGIAGTSKGSIEYVYNTGTIDGLSVKTGKGYIGGIVGRIPSAYGLTVTLHNSYNAGKVKTKAGAEAGAVVSGIATTGTMEVDNCYALEGTNDALIATNADLAGSIIAFKTSQQMKTEEFITTVNGDGNVFVPSQLGINDGYPVFQWQVDEVINELEQNKAAAKAELEKTYSPDNYYSPQKESIIKALSEAIQAIDQVTNSLQQVEMTKSEWKAVLDSYMTKTQVNSQLADEKQQACSALDEYLDFSGYSDSSKATLEKIRSQLQSAVDKGKAEINGITAETLAADSEAVAKKLAQCEEELNNLYASNGLWNGNAVADEYAPELSEGVYRISNAAELAWFANYVNTVKGGANAILTDDIDLGNNQWIPIGAKGNASLPGGSGFTGSFDGAGHTVYGLNIQVSDDAGIRFGLFGNAGVGSTVSNLTVEGKIAGESTSNNGAIGGICAESLGNIINCTSRVNINVSYPETWSGPVGGIVGNGRSVLYCTNEGTVSGKNSVGGIAGKLVNTGMAVFCVNKGNIGGKNQSNTGGILGSASSTDTDGTKIRSCYNLGDVQGAPAGGIVGYISGNKEEIKNVYNKGNITGSGLRTGAGGIVGNMGNEGRNYTEGTITNAYNAGEAQGGSIVAYLYNGQIKNCYGLKGTSISGTTASTGYTSISSCITVDEETLKGYAETLGEAFYDDTKDVNGGYPVLLFEEDDEETMLAKVDAIEKILSASKTPDKPGKYGTQISELYKVASKYQEGVEAATNAKDVQAALDEALKAIEAVPTELELKQQNAIERLTDIFDKNLYSQANEKVVKDFLDEAKTKISETDANHLGEVEAAYETKIKAVSTYTEDSKAELSTEKDALVAENNLSAGASKELEAICNQADKDIDEVLAQKIKGTLDSEMARDKIDDIFNEAKAAMAEKISAGSKMPELEISGDDSLKEAKTEAYQAVLDTISPGLEKDYREAQWKEVLAACETASKEISAATAEEDIDAAKEKGIEAIKGIATAAQMTEDEESLATEKANVKSKIAALMERTELLAAEAKEEAMALGDKAVKDIDEISIADQTLEEAVQAIQKIYDGLSEKVEELLKAVEGQNWTTAATEPEQINGVYQIGTAEELSWFANHVNGGNQTAKAVLTADIDLAGRMWTPIGSESNPFRGNFSGQGHKISNMYICSNQDALGLFGYLDNASVHDVTVGGLITSHGNAAVRDWVYAGGIAGYISHSSEIIGCVNETAISSGITAEEAGTHNNLTIGGIVGHIDYTYGDKSIVIERCVNKGKIDAEYCRAIGGIVGDAEKATNLNVNQCANLGKITFEERYTNTNGTSTEIYAYGAGGILGISGGSGNNVEHCYNAADIRGNENIGGIIGYVKQPTSGTTDSLTTVACSYNRGSVSAVNRLFCGSITGNAQAGTYEKEIYSLDGSSAKAMGFAVGENMVKTVSQETLKSAETLKSINGQAGGQEGPFTEAIAEINGGYPVFSWQLLDKDIKNEINEYIENYLNKEDFTEEQWQAVESITTAAAEDINAADNSQKVAESYKAALADLNKVQGELKEDIAKPLAETSTEGYSEELAAAIENLIEEKVADITDEDTNPKEAMDIYNEAKAEIADLVIEAIDDEIVAQSEAGIKAARAAYNALNDEQRQSVKNYISLVEAENIHSDNKKAADKSEKLISGIGTVTLSSEPAIKKARTTYEALTEAQKTYVSEQALRDLTEAESRLKDLIDENSGAGDDPAKPNPAKPNPAKPNPAKPNPAKPDTTGSDRTDSKPADTRPGNAASADDRDSTHGGSQLPEGLQNLGGADSTGIAPGDDNSKNDIEGADVKGGVDVANGTLTDEDNNPSSKGFDWTIIPIALGIIALLAVAYIITRWFGAAKKRQRKE